MALYRHLLPQASGGAFITDGGIETTLIFSEGLELPHFAAFDLLRAESGTAALRKYFRTYAELARKYEVGLVLESATWRANPDWAAKLGYGPEELADANRKAISLLRDLRDELESGTSPMVISGCIGPRGDGYSPSNVMTADEAEEYHSAQIATFKAADADLVTAITMNYADEAIGVARAAAKAAMPVVISFTVEKDGNLPTGESLQDAIARVDEATRRAPAYYMINCAHPDHFATQLDGGDWRMRIGGIRANASRKSHAELNESTELDPGMPSEFGREHHDVLSRLPHVNVLGGCCGTDERHVESLCRMLRADA